MSAPTLIAAGWGVVVAAAVVHARPRLIARAAQLIAPDRRAARRGPPIALPSPRQAIVLIALAILPSIVFPPAGLIVLVSVAFRPMLRRRREAKASLVAVERDIGDVVVLLGLAVSAGHNLVGGLGAACARGDGPVSGAVRRSLAAVDRGERLADSLETMPDQLGEAVRPLVAALVSCDRYGAGLGATLDRLGVDVRTASRQRAEAAARRLPIRLLFPLITCILPAFALLTVAPLIAGSFRGLRL